MNADDGVCARVEKASGLRIEWRAECASTNTVLREQAEAGAPSGKALVADRQTAGRGRRGRVWHSTPEDSLTFSVLFRGGAGARAGLSLAAGLALLRALEKLGARALRLKWPNDLLCRKDGVDAKLAGVLIECAGDAVIIGVGLNLRAPDLPEQATAGLSDCMDIPVERSAALAAILRELDSMWADFAARGFAPLRADWQARHVWQEKSVRLTEAGRVLAEGVCRGVDDNGALRLAAAGGERIFWAGDLSLRAGAA
ncbi:MAG: biotin--[acetyl-CoA-carboxylase] ligase [Zoogloeaceae bacterium]|jgi:BirA family biotin operon repressor/biotin-[acetyl-CoA-carboxylase] ligase|nr:biotin--[acetyl-CoA-carboxylase] ligase [Zoogloeaceae bacterium]